MRVRVRVRDFFAERTSNEQRVLRAYIDFPRCMYLLFLLTISSAIDKNSPTVYLLSPPTSKRSSSLMTSSVVSNVTFWPSEDGKRGGTSIGKDRNGIVDNQHREHLCTRNIIYRNHGCKAPARLVRRIGVSGCGNALLVDR